MEFALCNEVLRGLSLAEQCRFAADLGYAGLEIAPFTLAEDPTRLGDRAVAEMRGIVEDHGLSVTGLHWLMIAPEGLSLTDPDPDVAARTGDAMVALVDLCAGLGGRVLVHGSPAQRQIGRDPAAARATAIGHLAAAGAWARAAGVTYCFEPVAADECDFVNLVAEAAAIVEEVGDAGLRTMIDTCHACKGEAEPLAALTERWLPTGLIAHFQLNDRNRRAPGQGNDRFGPLLATLKRAGWTHPLAVEPFVYIPDGPATAARAIGYLRGVLDGLATEGVAAG
jgi:D-psicose/D-tagatose/L-ribulose 3-epimerase